MARRRFRLRDLFGGTAAAGLLLAAAWAEWWRLAECEADRRERAARHAADSAWRVERAGLEFEAAHRLLMVAGERRRSADDCRRRAEALPPGFERSVWAERADRFEAEADRVETAAAEHRSRADQLAAEAGAGLRSADALREGLAEGGRR